jgi:hypothetical protein
LRNVQQEFLVVRFHFRKKLAQFGEVSGFLACASRMVKKLVLIAALRQKSLLCAR